MALSNQVVSITGCSSGIGRARAVELPSALRDLILKRRLGLDALARFSHELSQSSGAG